MCSSPSLAPFSSSSNRVRVQRLLRALGLFRVTLTDRLNQKRRLWVSAQGYGQRRDRKSRRFCLSAHLGPKSTRGPSRTPPRCFGWNFSLSPETQNWRRQEGRLPWFGCVRSRRGFFESWEVLTAFRQWLLMPLVRELLEVESGLDLRLGSRVRCWASFVVRSSCLWRKVQLMQLSLWILVARVLFLVLEGTPSVQLLTESWKNIQQWSLNYVCCLSALNIHRGGTNFGDNEDIKKHRFLPDRPAM